MYKSLIFILIITNSLIMLSIKSPLSLGIFVMMQTILICLFINMMINIYWISYILYLIMLGGLLILFMYMCSTASNEIINLQKNILNYFFVSLLISMISYLIMKFNLIDMSFMEMCTIMNNENKIIINKIYNKFSLNIFLTLIIYLLINLSMVTKLTNSNKGPLRSNK